MFKLTLEMNTHPCQVPLVLNGIGYANFPPALCCPVPQAQLTNVSAVTGTKLTLI